MWQSGIGPWLDENESENLLFTRPKHILKNKAVGRTSRSKSRSRNVKTSHQNRGQLSSSLIQPIESYFSPKQRAGFNFPGLALTSKGYPKISKVDRTHSRPRGIYQSSQASPNRKRKRQKSYVNFTALPPKVPNPTPIMRYITVGGSTFKVIGGDYIDKSIPFHVK